MFGMNQLAIAARAKILSLLSKGVSTRSDFAPAFSKTKHLTNISIETSSLRQTSALFTFTRFPKSQWKSIRTSHAIERLHEEFKRRIKTKTVLPSAETATILFWALPTSGQITMRKVDGWRSLNERPSEIGRASCRERV